MACVLVDAASGNLHSAAKAFERMARETGGAQIVVSSRPEDIAAADRLVVPGDGAFPACRRELLGNPGIEEALREAVERRAVPFLGICVGMQMLATLGREHKTTPGFGWVPGTVDRIDAPGLKVPHMGWNDLVVERAHPVLEGVATGDHAYFVHSYAMRVDDPADRLAHAEYGGAVTAVVARGNVVGTQFHPEKSQRAGLRIIANFLGWRP
ncbi:imidazole glycerol phosphate synthase subunit HisH [Jannaschia sp. W003]|uniref:imidazole glycerol phosphate synthase subunit HisH n=1 Tax=Jannaschia sp. W003 TaxID=2867012 RepID=UPI0021A2E1CC|nr:imidazole glycerol phosphate synthase subunit HisH [Jannaschia sp. W003]UWQ21117.1 imidazole glycerol phosphate synthase subunit HisH [Jannaschia sp. W003]